MASSLTFEDKEEAKEYKARMENEGFIADITYDNNTGKYRVTVTSGFETLPEEEYPETPKAIIEAEEAEFEFSVKAEQERASVAKKAAEKAWEFEKARREKGKAKRSAKEAKVQTAIGSAEEAAFEGGAGIIGSLGSKIHVKGGMRKAIQPHKIAIADIGPARIAAGGIGGGRPSIATVSGLPNGQVRIAEGLGLPQGAKFQIPYFKSKKEKEKEEA